jgi:hypothetical protein
MIRRESDSYQREIVESPGVIAELRSWISNGPRNTEIAERQVRQIDSAVANSTKRAENTRNSVIRMVSALLPPKDRSSFEARARSGALSLFAIQPPYSATSAPATNVVAMPPSRPIVAVVIDNIAPQVVGIDEKLNAIDAIATDLASLRAQQRQISSRPDALAGNYEEVARTNEQLRFQAELFRSEIERLRSQVYAIEARSVKASWDKMISSDNIYRAALTELVWNHFKESVVEPSVRRFIRINRLSTKADLAAAVNEIRQNPRKILSLSRHLRGIEDFLETQEKVLNLIPLFTQYSEEAANRLGSASLLADLKFDLRGSAAEIVEAAGGQSDGPTAKLRAWLFSKPSNQ